MRENLQEEEENILKIQEENVNQFYRKREEPKTINTGTFVAIQKIQYGSDIGKKMFRPCKVTIVTSKNRYDVMKGGQHDGERTMATSSSTEYMKLWLINIVCYVMHRIIIVVSFLKNIVRKVKPS